MEENPPVPEDLKRRVLSEAGHRCAIPTCRDQTTEVVHIEPPEEVKALDPEDLVALCPDCEARLGKGEIDRKLLKAYKRILRRLTARYSTFEVATLNELRQGWNVRVGEPMLPMVKNLLDEGLVEVKSPGISDSGVPSVARASLTEKGNRLIEEWIKGNEELAR